MANRTEVRPCENCNKPWPMRHRGNGVWARFCSIRCWNLSKGINPIATRYRKGEHRKVLEAKLGRKLLKHEVAHHINGIKTDNRPENLESMPMREHSRQHMTGNKNAMKHGRYAGRVRSAPGCSVCAQNSRG